MSSGEFVAASVVRQHIPTDTMKTIFGRTLIVFPYRLTASAAAIEAKVSESTDWVQLLLYAPGALEDPMAVQASSLFRRMTGADVTVGPDDQSEAPARRWGIRELLLRRLRESGLVIRNFVDPVVVASPLGAESGPSASARPWDLEDVPARIAIDPSRHLPRQATIAGRDFPVVLRADAAAGVFSYGAGTSSATRFNNDRVDPLTDTIKIDGHGFSDGQALLFFGSWNGMPSLVSGKTYYVTGAEPGAFQLSESRGGSPVDLTAPGPGLKTLTPRAATVPPFTTFRLLTLGDESSPAAGKYRPATATDVAGPDFAVMTLSRLDRVAFAAVDEVGFPDLPVDLNFARPTTWAQATFSHSDVGRRTPNAIFIPYHGFADGDELLYATSGAAVGGLTAGNTYFVAEAEGDEFKLVANPDDSAVLQLVTPAAGRHYFARRDVQYVLPPQVDITCWSSRPGEVVTTQWGVNKYSKSADLALVKSGVAPAIALRRPRADASGTVVNLALREPVRSLGGGRFAYGEWDVTQTIDRTPSPASERCVTVLSLPRSVYPGRSSASVAEQDPITVPFYVAPFEAAAVILDPSRLIFLPGHRFRNGDEVFYRQGTVPIGGLTDGGTYFVVNTQVNTLQVAAASGGAPIDLMSTGSGSHTLFRRPKVNLEVLAGKDYSPTNQELTKRTFLIRTSRGTPPAPRVNEPLDDNLHEDILAELLVSPADSHEPDFDPSDVDPVADRITINDHGFGNGVRLIYSALETPIGGLESGASYYVVNAATNTFQLALVRGGAAINILTQGTGTHKLSGEWSHIGDDVYRYAGAIDEKWLTERSASGTIGLYRYELDTETDVWTSNNTSGGFLSFDIIDKSAIVPDAPLSLAIVAQPESEPHRIRLIGSGRIEPRMQRPGIPESEIGVICWQSRTQARAIFRRQLLDRSDQPAELEFGVRLSGPEGEAIPY